MEKCTRVHKPWPRAHACTSHGHMCIHAETMIPIMPIDHRDPLGSRDHLIGVQVGQAVSHVQEEGVATIVPARDTWVHLIPLQRLRQVPSFAQLRHHHHLPTRPAVSESPHNADVVTVPTPPFSVRNRRLARMSLVNHEVSSVRKPPTRQDAIGKP